MTDIRAATIVVASETSKNKKEADYITVGQRGGTAIQSAIDALPSGGGRIVLLEGTHWIPQSLTVPSNVMIQGQGWSTILKLISGADQNVFTLNTGASGISIQDLELNGNDARDSANNSGAINNGIFGTDVARLLFCRLRIQNFKRGIHFASVPGGFCGNHFTTDCWIASNSVHGINAMTDSHLIGSFIGENGQAGSGATPALDVEPGDGAVSNKIFYCNVRVDGWASRIVGCHIWGGGTAATRSKRGVYCYYVNDLFVSSCLVEEHQQEGIYARGRFNGSRIVDNFIEDNGKQTANTYDGISVPSLLEDGVTPGIDSGQTSEAVTVVGNRFGKVDSSTGALATANHRRCITTGTRCNRWLVVGNMMRLGYQTAMGAPNDGISLTGANNVTGSNLDNLS